MKKRIVSCLSIIGLAGLVFAFGDLLIPQENVIFEAAQRPQAFAELVTSSNYSIWAARGLVGVLMEMIGTVGLYLYLQQTKAERLAFYGLLLTLTHHILGVGVFALAIFLFPAVGEMVLAGQPEAVRFATMDGALGAFMGASLVSTLAGLALMAVAIWRSGILPKWSGWLVFLGFALVPVPSVALQFFTNILWGTAYFWMAYTVYRNCSEQQASEEKPAGQLIGSKA
ncbi:hypothetical protein [Pontibacter akesuensis]|uniref:DUF4386 domain-containing protein n=1 Tax=Pontibacter akesuensis TaxID=388950 RepID=A0A1I7I2E8_9BACT|nr:hypothetical protein [Pontibacter akesuensis]GHA64848.1 hypothetical protein GCM10007389_17000 [Pontibacter akesuensis]SFU67122.1 hypothetical protein SAMN04487941_1861 [Pontibacter akesuensis]